MDVRQEARQAEKAIEIAEKLEALQKSEGWKLYIELLDTLILNEEKALRGQVLTKKYYKRIGMIQMLRYIREIPGIVKDKKIVEYLLHQGRAQAVEGVKSGVFNHYRKMKQIAIQKLKQLAGSQTDVNAVKRQHGEDVFKQQG